MWQSFFTGEEAQHCPRQAYVEAGGVDVRSRPLGARWASRIREKCGVRKMGRALTTVARVVGAVSVAAVEREKVKDGVPGVRELRCVVLGGWYGKPAWPGRTMHFSCRGQPADVSTVYSAFALDLQEDTTANAPLAIRVRGAARVAIAGLFFKVLSDETPMRASLRRRWRDGYQRTSQTTPRDATSCGLKIAIAMERRQ